MVVCVYMQVYHAYYKPLEFYLPDRDATHCYIKVGMHAGESICLSVNNLNFTVHFCT